MSLCVLTFCVCFGNFCLTWCFVLLCFFFVSSFLSIVNIIIFYRVMIKWMGGDIGRIRGELGAGEEYDQNVI